MLSNARSNQRPQNRREQIACLNLNEVSVWHTWGVEFTAQSQWAAVVNTISSSSLTAGIRGTELSSFIMEALPLRLHSLKWLIRGALHKPWTSDYSRHNGRTVFQRQSLNRLDWINSFVLSIPLKLQHKSTVFTHKSKCFKSQFMQLGK